ncbi:MAG: UDP-N-acetylglucosamine 2-epimerase (non-hydrolyzing), partial [Candidatus Melainabacteria bacterium]|nr:UDP-N-acetylglucosamine 2-epimerase (non-hydrolyzing) [Candidatus Melainabacteria bacterium]
PMKIMTVLGTRPQIIKAGPVSAALAQAGITEVLVHTGQHYDSNMSDVFFDELGLKPPQYMLSVGSGTLGYQVGEGLQRIEAILKAEAPDMLLVYGDTSATMAGALAAAYHHIPLAHVEAGLRSFNRRMPEEINRVTTDHLAQWCFVPTQTAVENLAKEGICHGQADRYVYRVGDVMLDAATHYLQRAQAKHPDFYATNGLTEQPYVLLTMHRAETTAAPEKVLRLLQQLDTTAQKQGWTVLFPVHPRTQPLIEAIAPTLKTIRCVPPLSYLEMLLAEAGAYWIVTDSGGVQKEAAFFQVPCLTLRTETEWVETITSGWNQIVGFDPETLGNRLLQRQVPEETIHHLYGHGQAAQAIAKALLNHYTPARAVPAT